MLPMYLRKEPTRYFTQYAKNPDRFDVVAYRDPECKTKAGYWAWYSINKPRRSSRYVTFNCYRWQPVWVD